MVTGLPSWSSYSISQLQVFATPAWRLDARLESSHMSICDRLPSGIDSTSTLVPLFPFGK